MATTSTPRWVSFPGRASGRRPPRIAFQPRPGRWGIRQFFFEFEPEYITNLQNRLENWRFFIAPFNVRTESGEHLEWNVIPEFEHLDTPFEIYPGVVVPRRVVSVAQVSDEANTATKRWWVVDVGLLVGRFYDGTRREAALGLTLKPNAHVSIAPDWRPQRRRPA